MTRLEQRLKKMETVEGNRRQFQEVCKEILADAEVRELLDQTNPGAIEKMAGTLFSTWLPPGVSRKGIMVLLLLAALMGSVFVRDMRWLLLLLVIPMFSPRCMG